MKLVLNNSCFIVTLRMVMQKAYKNITGNGPLQQQKYYYHNLDSNKKLKQHWLF